MKQTTIFKQLILNILIPVVVAMFVLAFTNFKATLSILTRSNSEKNEIISEEIKNIVEFQDVALALIEEGHDIQLKELSTQLVRREFLDTDGIESADLTALSKRLGMDTLLIDIYVIDRNGVVVNTTFAKDLGLNFFSFGENHKKYLLNILNGSRFVSERFSVESSTNKLKKYSYQSTVDHKYIIELGAYSKKADEVLDLVKLRLNNLSQGENDIVSVDLFIGEDNPVSFNSDQKIDSTHLEAFYTAFEKSLTTTMVENKDGKLLNYEYVFMKRSNSDLYKGSVIRIVTDRTGEKALIFEEMLTFFVVFIPALFILLYIIYIKTKVITDPIKVLVHKVNAVKEGRLDARAEVTGTNEVAVLSMHFNEMLDKLQTFYDDLEDKVRQRTAEIEKQKQEILEQNVELEQQNEEIASQRDMLADFNNKLEVQKNELEEQRKRVTDSIKYAKRIQTAILPTEEQIQELIPEHFLLYRPMSIVSGDYYWAGMRDGKAIIAAVDSTGHGIPAAFMSMIGNTLLNQIINEKGLTDPGEILAVMRDSVIESLKQTGEEGDTKDGYDVALCTIELRNNLLEYAGAHNPLYLVRNGELHVYKGDKQPVGYFMGHADPFTTHRVEVQKGDMCYIFTDGYQDQFGGPDKRKFLVGRFKRLLQDIASEPLEKQKQILDDTMTEWLGHLGQIDDILIIGIKF